MINKVKRRLSRVGADERGFTLIELLLVVLIAAVLAAVGFAILSGLLGSSQDSRAQASLDSAKTAAASYFVKHHESFKGFTAETVANTAKEIVAGEKGPAAEESITGKGAGTAENNPHTVYVETPATGAELVMCSAPNKGTAVWCVATAEEGAEWCYGEGETPEVTMADVATGLKAKSSYGSQGECKISGLSGYSTEGF